MSRRERSFMIRLSVIVGMIAGTALRSWWVVLGAFLFFLLLSVYDATKERHDR